MTRVFGWHHAPGPWAEIWEKAVSWVPASEEEGCLSGLGEARWLCALRAPRVGWVESWRCKSSQHRKIVSLSPHVEKPLNSKRWIKVLYLNQFRVFGFLYMFMNILWTLCLFDISVSWVCNISCPFMRIRRCQSSAKDREIIVCTCIYISKSKVGDLSRGWPKGSLFNSYYTEELGRTLLHSLDFSTLPLIHTLWCWVLSKGTSSTFFLVFGMTWPGIEPQSSRPLVNTLSTWPMSWYIYIYIYIYICVCVC